jgi:Ca-activated chloride channel family protein
VGLSVLLCAVVHAQIIIPIPPPPPHPIPPPWPRPQLAPPEIREHKVEVKMVDGAISTAMDLVFFNPNNVPYEGELVFEVPGDAALHDLSMLINGKEVRAELLSREEARRIYEDTVRRMRDPALLEITQERLIRARVFPIPAGGEQRIKLKYSHQLQAEDGLYTYRYPLRSRVPAAKPCQKFSIVIRIESQVPIKSVVCPTHKVDVVLEGDRRASASYEAERLQSDNDLVLYVTVSQKDVGLKLVTYREKGKDGYFMAMLGPGYDPEKEAEIQAKAVVFAIDTSGSMSGEQKIDQVRQALKYCLEHLNPGDKFNVVDFSTTARAFRPELVPAEKGNIEQAVKYVADLEARGGTAIADALKTSVAMGRSATVPFLLVFLTDGKPTIGTDDTQQLLDVVKAGDAKTLRLFPFGVGYEVNTHLLDRLAQEYHGATTYVLPGEDVAQKLVSLHRKITYPALTDMALEFKGIRVYDLFPPALPDLFRGVSLTVVGRYEGSGDKAIELSGTLLGTRRRFTHEGTFAEEDTRSDWLPRAWATRKIGYLLDQIRLRGEKPELKDEVVRLSKEFGIMTPYTSFLVFEDEARRVGPPPPVPMPMRAETLGPAARDFMNAERKGMREAEGAGAVRSAMGLDRMKAGELEGVPGTSAVDESLRQVMRRVGGQTYYLVNDRWVASTWDGKQESVKVKYMSDEYFRLARENKELARAFALGVKVIAECKGKFYEVVE